MRLETPHGNIVIAVDAVRAPTTAANFLKYVDGGFYDGGRFHRATREDNYTPNPPNRPMMNIIQGGINPERRSEGFDPIPLERTSVTGLKHVRGVVSMARGGPDSATSDFFILLDDQPSLDFGGLRFDDGQGGAAFGRVVQGLDVVEKIQQQPVQGQNLTPPVPIARAVRVAGGMIVVRVVDSGLHLPLPGVRVTLCGSPHRSRVTAAAGDVTFSNVPPGGHTLELRLAGFHPVAVVTDAGLGESTEVNQVMASNPNAALVPVKPGLHQVREADSQAPVCGVVRRRPFPVAFPHG